VTAPAPAARPAGVTVWRHAAAPGTWPDTANPDAGPDQWACQHCGAAYFGTPPESELCPGGCENGGER
jgi:hypothetical protein